MTTTYGSDAGFKAWADARAVSYAGKTDDDIAAARLRASEAIDGRYRARFEGQKTGGRAQDREWPRAGACDREGLGIASDVIPAEIENATYEGTVRELASAGSLSPDIQAGAKVLKRVKAGSTELEYALQGTTTATFQRIDQALAPLIGAVSRYSGRVARG